MHVIPVLGAALMLTQGTGAPQAPTEAAIENSRPSSRGFSRVYAEGELRLQAITPEIVRVLFVPKGANERFPRIPIVRKEARQKVGLVITEKPSYIELRTASLSARVHKDLPRVDFYDAHGKRLSLDSTGVTQPDGKLTASRAISADEEFFGGGLQFHSMAQRGKTKALKVNADPNSDLGNSHAVVPFFLSTAGYGIYLDSHGYTHFDFGKSDSGRLSFQTPDPVMDYYFIAAKRDGADANRSAFHSLLEGYTRLTGRMDMPPKWGLGFWYRMKSEWNSAKVEEVADEFRKRGIPCDVIGLEPKWQTHSYSCSYVWNPETFPDPKAFVGWMRDRHFRLNLWEHAYVHPSAPIHEYLKQAGVVGDKEVWGGLVPDFTMPQAEEIFARQHIRDHISLGVAGYKLDECDGSDFTGGWFFPDDAKFPSGLSGAQMHNVFGYLYQKAFHEIFEKQNLRSYFLVRGMFAGGQAYPSVIYSDWYGFKEYLRAAVNSGFSGILWCPEIRQTEDPKEFVRRFQVVFFSPLAMVNAWADGVTPWEKGPEVERIFRLYADLRMQLTPYLYSGFRRMHDTGLPIVRALVVDSPDDSAAYAIDDEFLYGDSLLVAPVLSGDKRALYLPKGRWTDWWTGETFAGGKTIEYAAPLDRLPLFARAGAIVPMQRAETYAGEKPVTSLAVRVYTGDAASAFVLYEDDGETLNYRTGKYVSVRLACEPADGVLTLRAERGKGSYVPTWKSVLWEIHGVDRQPRGVLLARRRLESVSSAALAEKPEGWSYDADSRVLRVKRRSVRPVR